MSALVRRVVAIACIATFAGCATPAWQIPTAIDTELAQAPLVCHGAEQCTRYWKRAQVWVFENGHYGIETATDALIITDQRRAEMWFWFKVVREPQAGDREEIRMTLGCNNRFGCVTHPDTQIAMFKRYVSAL